ICAADRFFGPNYHSFDDVALFDGPAWDGIFDGGDDNVADGCIAASWATEDTDGENFFPSGVVGNLEPRFFLNHLLTPACLAGSHPVVGPSLAERSWKLFLLCLPPAR